jgi:hypothetical protein
MTDFADADDELSIEEQARARGWKPLPADPDNPQPGEYQGDPRRHRSADDFLRYGEQDRAILAEENRRMAARIHRQGKQIEALTLTSQQQLEAISELRNLARRADEQGYKRALNELKERRSEAVEAGDKGAFDQIEAQINALETERVKEVEAVKPEPPAVKLDPAIKAFIDANPWYTKDKGLNETMIANYSIMERRHPDETVEELLKLAKKRTMEDFPEKFPRRAADPAPPEEEYDDVDDAPPPQRRPAPTLARPSGNPQRERRGPAGWDVITDPDERKQAQAAYESIRKGDPGMTAQEYLTIYMDPRADPLALRKARK